MLYLILMLISIDQWHASIGIFYQGSKNLVHACIMHHMCTKYHAPRLNTLEFKLFEFKLIIIMNIIQVISSFNLPRVLESEQVNKFSSLKPLSI